MTDLSEDFVYGMKERRTDLIERSIHVTDGGPNYQSPPMSPIMPNQNSAPKTLLGASGECSK